MEKVVVQNAGTHQVYKIVCNYVNFADGKQQKFGRFFSSLRFCLLEVLIFFFTFETSGATETFTVCIIEQFIKHHC